MKWITALCQEHCWNTSDYWGDGISAFLYRLGKCQGMLFPVVGGRWLGRIGSVIEIMHFYCFTSPKAILPRCTYQEPRLWFLPSKTDYLRSTLSPNHISSFQVLFKFICSLIDCGFHLSPLTVPINEYEFIFFYKGV